MVSRFADHGTYKDVVDFALLANDDRLETWEFLNAWNHGDLGEWPEFYTWLAARRAAHSRKRDWTNAWGLFDRRRAA